MTDPYFEQKRKEGSYKRWEAISRYLPKEPQTILDIGCNTGFFSLSAAALNHRVVGLDTDKNCIQEALEKVTPDIGGRVVFVHIDNLLSELEAIPDDAYDYVFYMSVHHHVIEDYGIEASHKILSEISRISRNMFFDMGQSDEKDSEWLTWLPRVRALQKDKPKSAIQIDVIRSSSYVYSEIITSTTIHETERLCYFFTREEPAWLSPKTLNFDGKDYRVIRYMLRTESGDGRNVLFTEGFPFNYDSTIKSNTRYYIVEDEKENRFFIKELMYNEFWKLTPEENATKEFEIGQAIAKDHSISQYVITPIKRNKGMLMYPFVPWPSILDRQRRDIPEAVGAKILEVAEKIRSVIGLYDFNLNNILYNEGNFFFINTDRGEVDWPYRVKLLKSVTQNAAPDPDTQKVRVIARKAFGRKPLPMPYYKNGAYFAQSLLFECPAKCDFCIIHGRGLAPTRKILSAKEILTFWNDILHPEGYPISLLGGEPTLRNDIVDIVNGLEGYHITITTNLGTAFFDNPDNLKKMRKDNLRINTSFHPKFISVEKFAKNFIKLQDEGFYVDQLDMVNHPNSGFEKYQAEFLKYGLELGYAPFLGFYRDEKFAGAKEDHNRLVNFGPNDLYPNEREHDKEHLKMKCGIEDIDRFRLQCGASKPMRIPHCGHHVECLLVSPEGNIYDCHYKLYYNIDPTANIWDITPLENVPETKPCNYFGFCNWCDYPRSNAIIMQHLTEK